MTPDQAITSMDYVQLLAGTGVAVSGACAHWLKKFARGEVESTLKEYFFVKNRAATVNAAFATLGSSFILVGTGQADPTLFQGIVLLFTTGYSLDSAVNK